DPAVVEPDKLMRKTLEVMDKHNISKAFLSGVDYAAVQEWANKAPDRFIPSPFVLKPDSSNLEKLRDMFASGQFKGMGEIGTQLHGISPNDQSMEPYFELSEKLDLPVLIHTLGIGPYMPHFRSSA